MQARHAARDGSGSIYPARRMRKRTAKKKTPRVARRKANQAVNNEAEARGKKAEDMNKSSERIPCKFCKRCFKKRGMAAHQRSCKAKMKAAGKAQFSATTHPDIMWMMLMTNLNIFQQTRVKPRRVWAAGCGPRRPQKRQSRGKSGHCSKGFSGWRRQVGGWWKQ